MAKRTRIVVVVLAVLAVGESFAWALPIVPIGPFVGNLQETWESFDNYLVNPDRQLANPTTIMGGAATIGTGANEFNPNMLVYEPSAGATFSTGTSGFLTAQVADGTKGMGTEAFGGPDGTTTILFSVPVSSFGAYWGAWTGDAGACCNIPDPATIFVSFYDTSLNLISTESFTYSRSSTGDGVLEWQGWSSTIPIGKIEWVGNIVKVDGLQAQAVPEPGTITLLGAGLFALARRVRSRRD